MSRTARSVNLTLTYLIITTMILSGIQAMLPALGNEWYSQNEQNLKDDSENSFVAANDYWSTPSILGSGGNDPSLAIDSNDNTHVTYFEFISGAPGESPTYNLEYMTYDGSSWSTPITLYSGGSSSCCISSLAIDSNDNLHVTYTDDAVLMYMTYDGSSWSTPIILDFAAGVGSSLAIDSNDDLHVTYLESVGKDLKYMTYDGSSWSDYMILDILGDVGYDSSLAIDSNDDLHVTYTDYTNTNLEYMYFNGIGWSTPITIANIGFGIGGKSSLAIDSNDDLHVTYLDSYNYNLEYMTYDGSSWIEPITLDNTVSSQGKSSSLAIDSNDDLHVTYTDYTNNNLEYRTYGGSSWSNPASISGYGYRSSLAIDSNDTLHVTYTDFALLYVGHDFDGDNTADIMDACPHNYGTSSEDRLGCIDADGDGWSDLGDDFHNKPTQWKDSDGDGLGDNYDSSSDGPREPHWPGSDIEDAYLADDQPLDWDNDGYEDDDIIGSQGDLDDCKLQYGTSNQNGIFGCPDADGDGYDDANDEFPGDPAEYLDTDGDGWGDNSDEFPHNADEWEDSDGDGTGDNADDAPYDPQETSDSDGDGYGDSSDSFPNDDQEWEDSDGDNVGDNSDEFPYDSSETIDSDGDGFGDNSDVFPNDPSEWYDTDNDTYGDNMDWFPYDSSEWEDSDMDGVGDNSDAFPYDFTEYADSDNDTYGDNWDSCPYTAGNTSGWNGNFGCPDTDGDGWADSDDNFPNDATQNMDFDGDGYGENGSGNNPDACPGQAGTSTIVDDGAGEPVTGYGCPDNDNDGYANNIDNCPSISGTSTVDSYACPDDDDDGISNSNDPYPYNATDNPEDWDNDGYLDHADNEDLNIDDFPEDSTQWEDSDGDGYGDNQAGNNADAFPNDSDEWEDTDSDGIGDNSDDCIYSAGNSSEDSQGCPDSDGDGWADSDDDFPNDATQNFDFDGDGYGENMSGNNPDSCPGQYGTSTLKVSGYMPSSSGPSSPGGGPGGGSPGYSPPDPGTNITWYGCPDEDSDSYEDNSDPCPFQYGNSWVDRFGCSDQDQDGISDSNDPYPNSATTDIEDWDGDGVTDHSSDVNLNLDDFPNDNTQTTDSDGDGYGDNLSGNNPDAFPNDSNEWQDTDGDGVGDNSDDCVNSAGNSTNFEQGCPDADGDGFADEFDAFPNDNTQWDDWDGDGYGDNFSGTNPDACPNQAGTSTMKVSGYMPSASGSSPPGGAPGGSPGGSSAPNPGTNMTWYGCLDSDSDNYEDNTDPCPYQYGNSWVDRYGCLDADLDGISDSNDPYPNSAATDVNDWDGDGYPDHSSNNSENTDSFPNDNSQWSDSDLDGYGDNVNGTNPDAFPADPFEWGDSDGDGVGDNSDDCVNSAGNSTQFETGCPDTDGDGYANSNDAFPQDDTQWEDWDGDGYGDSFSGTTPDSCPNQAGTSTMRVFSNSNQSWYGCVDSDSDNYEDNTDQCPFQFGNSWVDRFACLDTDLDGISDLNDPYLNIPTENVEDWDDDGYLDHSENETLNVDAFPNDYTQWEDADGDGMGDNVSGNNPDLFPNNPLEWSDSDSDGYGDHSDDCVNSAGNSTYFDIGCPDTDGDGYANLNDAFPQDDTQWNDNDGDGYGDSLSGTNPDACMFDFGTSTQRVMNGANESWFGCIDSDSDGFEDNTDPCPFQYGNSWVDRFGCSDQDQDGISDFNDPVPNVATMDTEDWDGDGHLDHAANSSNNADAFPNDDTQWSDSDSDGYGDNPNGNNPDLFVNISSQWEDFDNDGYGDNNQIGAFEPDSCPFDYGTSYQNQFGCADEDGDGWADIEDDFIRDETQWSDFDNDGYGDNPDGNDSDDCYTQGGTSTLTVNISSNTLESLHGCLDSDGDEIADTGDPCPFLFGNSWVDRYGCPDTDLDGISDLNDPNEFESTENYQDWDNDGYLDHAANSSNNVDAFPEDSTQWSDADGDGYGDNSKGNNGDAFPEDSTQWEDSDGDGFGDETNGNEPDNCPFEYGNSSIDRLGCIDTDGDGFSDESSGWRAHPYGYADSHPDDPTQWEDADGDGYGDNPQGFEYDAFPDDFYENIDTDGDGLGDNSDWCPRDAGTSDKDGVNGCPDSDGDGYADEIDAFKNEPTQWSDVDFDEHGDNPDGVNGDYFPFIPGQWEDLDGDGYGDNPTGPFADVFPNDSTQWTDYDGDNCGDNQDGNNPDRFPTDPTQCEDTDGDGYGDNPNGRDPDMFTDIYSQWSDIDGDGLGDNISEGASLADVCIDQETGNQKSCIYDRDNDGFDDLEDQFPDEPTQWIDADEDGKGDNPQGYNGDPYKNDRDNDGYQDPENEDSYLDEGEGGSCLIIPEEILFEDAGFEGGNVVKNQIYDEFPDSPSEWLDRDNDCLGDNLDADDDNDGSSDMEELVAGTNPYASGETPWGGVWIPGANVELGAWDLIGVLIGVPSVFYLGFAFITRDRRAMRYEEELLDCDDVVTLEQISEGYERALMMRLLGPHHGLMLERVRSRIEVQIETRGGRPRPADIVADAVKKKSKKTAPEIIEEDNNHED